MSRHGSAADDLCVSVRVMLMGGKVTNSFNTNKSTKHFDILLCATSAQQQHTTKGINYSFSVRRVVLASVRLPFKHDFV